MKKAEEKPAVEMTVGGKPKSGASHPPWKSLRDSHIPTARRLLYIFKTFARKEPSSAIASGYGFRLILRLEKTGRVASGVKAGKSSGALLTRSAGTTAVETRRINPGAP